MFRIKFLSGYKTKEKEMMVSIRRRYERVNVVGYVKRKKNKVIGLKESERICGKTNVAGRVAKCLQPDQF